MAKFDYNDYIELFLHGDPELELYVRGALEQFSMTPEGKQRIIMAADQNDGILTIMLADSNFYSPGGGPIGINRREIAQSRIETPDGRMKELTLQEVLFEEIYHAGDPNSQTQELGTTETVFKNLDENSKTARLNPSIQARAEQVLFEINNIRRSAVHYEPDERSASRDKLVSLLREADEYYGPLAPQTELDAAVFLQHIGKNRYGFESKVNYFATDSQGTKGFEFYSDILVSDEERQSIVQYSDPNSAMNIINALNAAEEAGACRNLRQCIRRSERNEEFLAPYRPSENKSDVMGL